MEFFKILGIDPPRLKIDLKELEREYYKLSLMHHPDRNRSGACSVDLTAKLNEAYKTLRDPWARAEYFLEQSGLSLDSKVPPRLAELYFELQDAQDSEALEKFGLELSNLSTTLDFDLRKIFEAYDADTLHSGSMDGSGTALKNLKELVTEHTYARSMLRDIEQKSSHLLR